MRKIIPELRKVAVLLAFGFICVYAGFITTVARVFPYNFFHAALFELARPKISLYQSDMYNLAGSSLPGVTRYNPEKAYNGYTIFTSANTQGAYLINMQGQIVHKWYLPYSRVWNDRAAVKHPRPSNFIFWDKAHLYSNGDILAVYVCFGQKPWGYGLVKMDQYSHPIWSYLQHVHHDVTVGPDGKIYTLTQNFVHYQIKGMPGTTLPVLDNSVVVLSPEGEVLKKVSVLNAFQRSKYHRMLALDRGVDPGDPLHLNSVNPMPPSFHKIFPFAGPNTVLISSRTLSTIALLDLDSRKIIWVQHGPFARQHDAEFVSNGDIMVFDNLGASADGGESRALEFQPNPFKIVWQFPGNTGEKLDSQIFGAVQQLPNGNVLISDDDQGRILEVTPDKKVVWEYNSPFRGGPDKKYVAIIRWARRFAPDQLHFKLSQPEPIVNRASAGE